MIPGVRCKTCAYWTVQTQSVYGQCHRYPPRPDVVEAESETVQRDVRPLTTANEWCGEWKGKVKREKPVETPPKGVRLV